MPIAIASHHITDAATKARFGSNSSVRDLLDSADFARGFRSDFGASSVATETVERLDRSLARRVAVSS